MTKYLFGSILAGLIAVALSTAAAQEPAGNPGTATPAASQPEPSKPAAEPSTSVATPPAGNLLTLTLAEGVTMQFAPIPAGTFTMGSPATEEGHQPNEEPAHQATITAPFHMGIYEVTQAQFQAIMGENPSQFKEPSKPVEMTSWVAATEFCQKVSQITGRTVRLPTEAEWEYACRAGSTTRFCFGDDEAELDKYGWHSGNSERTSHPVGQKLPNAWGLYDMHGNVWEWVQDWYAPYPEAAQTDPKGPTSGPADALRAGGSARVTRGGSFSFRPVHCRSATRGRGAPDGRNNHVFGFRVVVEDAPAQPAAQTQPAVQTPPAAEKG